MNRIPLAMVTLLAIAASCPGAPPQEADGDRADWSWLWANGRAALVFEPARLAGVDRWTIESPRHRGPIACLAVSPDGTRAATGGCDGVVRIWNLETGELDRAFIGHGYHLFTMDWSPDGTLLATHSWGERKLCVWDVATGALRKSFQPVQMRSLRWSPDGRKLAGCTLGSGSIYVSEGLADPVRLTEIGQPIYALDYAPDSGRLAVTTVGGGAMVLDAGSGKLVTTLETGDESFSSVRFAPSGDRLATGNARGATIWDAATGTRSAEIKSPAADLEWSPDGTTIATVSAAGVRLWKAADGGASGGLAAPGGRIRWNAKAGRIVVVSDDRLQAWAPDGTAATVSIDAGGSAAPVYQAGKPIVTGVGTPTLAVWDPITFKRIGTLEGHAKPVTVAAWSSDGKRFASGAADGTVRIWDVKKGVVEHECDGHTGRITGLAWSPDGTSLGSASHDKTVRLWSATGQAAGTFEGHAKPVEALAWSPNGRQVASGGRDEKLLVWDAATCAEKRAVEFAVPITSLAWAAVGGVPAIACGFGDSSVRVVNPTDGGVMVTLGNPSNWYATSAVAWMPGNRPLLLTSRYYLTQLWDVAQARTVQRQIVPGGAAAVFSTNGGTLAVARAEDRTIRFWDPAGGSLRGVLLDEGGTLVAVSTVGDVKHDPETTPPLIAIVETAAGQRTISLEELAKAHRWKNNGKVLKLPTKN